jgi:transketolase
MASGSEVSLIVEAGTRLAMEGVNVRLVSFPSWELFQEQEAGYRESVLPAAVRARVAVEAGIGMGWEKFVGQSGGILSLERYGASAPGATLFREFGFGVDRIVELAREVVK